MVDDGRLSASKHGWSSSEIKNNINYSIVPLNMTNK